LDDRDAAVPLDRGEPGRPVVVRAGEDDSDRTLAVAVGDRFEQDVDGRPRVLHASFDREREPPTVDQQVIVRRRDVHMTGLDQLLVARLGDRPRDVQLEQVFEHAAARFGRAVLRDDDRLVEVLRDALE
jgi:hypothetical protein